MGISPYNNNNRHLERDDIESVLKFLKNHLCMEEFVLWGRSMGATTAILHQLKYGCSRVKALVLDSPFHTLDKLAIMMVGKTIPVLPKFLVRTLFGMVSK